MIIIKCVTKQVATCSSDDMILSSSYSV